MTPASGPRWFVVTAVIMAAVALNSALGRPAGAAVDTAKLSPLRADLEAAAATSESLYHQTGRLLVELAKAELTDPAVRSNAVAAIRTITRSSSRLAERSRQLSAALEPLPVGIPGTAEQLQEALASYRAAEQNLEPYVDELQRRIDAAKAAEAANEFALELEAFTRSATAYDKVAQTVEAVLGDLEGIVVGQMRAPGGIRLSVYGLFDDRTPSENGYGLYTHVLFASESDRNAALLRELLEHPKEDLFFDQRAAINLFAIPVLNRISATLIVETATSAASKLASPKAYNYEQAQKILGQICLSARDDAPDLCSGDWQGPFLVTHSQYLSGVGSVKPPYLLVDLSDISESAFGEFVRAVKQQVMLPDFTSREKIDTFRLQLLSVTLQAADLLKGPLKEGVQEILALVKGS